MPQTAQSAAKNAWAYAYRAAITKVVQGLEEAFALEDEFNARGFSGAIDDDDLVGGNEGMTAALISNALGSHTPIKALLDQGHATNLHSVRIR